MSKRAHTIITILAVLVAVVALTTRIHVTHTVNDSPGARAEPATPKGWTPQGGPVETVVVHSRAAGGQVVTARLPDGTPVRGVSCPDGITYLAATEAKNGTSTTASVMAPGGGATTKNCYIPGVGATK